MGLAPLSKEETAGQHTAPLGLFPSKLDNHAFPRVDEFDLTRHIDCTVALPTLNLISERFMKVYGLLLAILFAVPAKAADVTFSGSSANFYYSLLASRGNGVTPYQAKSLLGSPIAGLSLHGIVNCGQKSGWVLTSVQCSLTGTNSYDILGTKVISFSQDELVDLLADVNWIANRTSVLTVGGASAARLYLAISMLEGRDPSFRKSTGTTKILRNAFESVSISEVYCQKTHGRILGDSYKCAVSNVTVSDSNAPTTVVTDSPRSNPANR